MRYRVSSPSRLSKPFTKRRPFGSVSSPEAALWFYTGLYHWTAGEPEYAVFYFRKAWQHDQKFLIARCWEMKSYEAIGMDFVSQRIGENMRKWHGNPDVAAMAAEAHKRSQYVLDMPETSLLNAESLRAFMEALAQDRRFSFFSASWIREFVREKDLRLTGDFEDYNGPQHWLMIDTAVVFVPAEDGMRLSAVALRDAFSGETLVSVDVPAQFAGSPAECAELAKRLAQSEMKASQRVKAADLPGKIPPDPFGSGQTAYLPVEEDHPAVRLAKSIRLCRQYPSNPYYLHLCSRWQPGNDEQAFICKGVEVLKGNPSLPYAEWYLASFLERRFLVLGRSPTLRDKFKELLELFPESVPALLVRYGLSLERKTGRSWGDEIQELLDIEVKLDAYIKANQKFTLEECRRFKAIDGKPSKSAGEVRFCDDFQKRAKEERTKQWSNANFITLRKVLFNLNFLIAWERIQHDEGKIALVHIDKAETVLEELEARSSRRPPALLSPYFAVHRDIENEFDVGMFEVDVFATPPKGYPFTREGWLDLDQLRRMAEGAGVAGVSPPPLPAADPAFSAAPEKAAVTERQLDSLIKFVAEYEPAKHYHRDNGNVFILLQAGWLYLHLQDKERLRKLVDAFLRKKPSPYYAIELCYSAGCFEAAEPILLQLEDSLSSTDRCFALERRLEYSHFFKTPSETAKLLIKELARFDSDFMMKPGTLEQFQILMKFLAASYMLAHGMGEDAVRALRPMLEYTGKDDGKPDIDDAFAKKARAAGGGSYKDLLVKFPYMRSVQFMTGAAMMQQHRFVDSAEMFRASMVVEHPNVSCSYALGISEAAAKKQLALMAGFSQTPNLFDARRRLCDEVVSGMKSTPVEIYTILRSFVLINRMNISGMSKAEEDYWRAEVKAELKECGKEAWPYFLKIAAPCPSYICGQLANWENLEMPFGLMPPEFVSSVPLFAYYWDLGPFESYYAARHLSRLDIPKERSLPWLIASFAVSDMKISRAELLDIVNGFGKPESAETIRLLSSMLESPNELARKLCAHALAKNVSLDLPRDKEGLPTDDGVELIKNRSRGVTNP